jgi:hypothetical protein
MVPLKPGIYLLQIKTHKLAHLEVRNLLKPDPGINRIPADSDVLLKFFNAEIALIHLITQPSNSYFLLYCQNSIDTGSYNALFLRETPTQSRVSRRKIGEAPYTLPARVSARLEAVKHTICSFAIPHRFAATGTLETFCADGF